MRLRTGVYEAGNGLTVDLDDTRQRRILPAAIKETDIRERFRTRLLREVNELLW